MPKTAINMPQVINLWRHFTSIVLKTVALTTALSNESDTSKILKTDAIIMALGPPSINAAESPKNVTRKDPLK